MYHFYIFNYCTTTITSLTNNLFFSILSSSTCVPVAIADMKTPAQVRAIREEAWAPFHKCFDKEYQLQACSLVTCDATNKYFYTVDGLIVDPVRLERTVDSPFSILACIDAHTCPTHADDVLQTDPRRFEGRRCVGVDVGLRKAHHGIVRKYDRRHKRFVIAYYAKEESLRALRVIAYPITLKELQDRHLDYDWTPLEEEEPIITIKSGIVASFDLQWDFAGKFFGFRTDWNQLHVLNFSFFWFLTILSVFAFLRW